MNISKEILNRILTTLGSGVKVLRILGDIEGCIWGRHWARIRLINGAEYEIVVMQVKRSMVEEQKLKEAAEVMDEAIKTLKLAKPLPELKPITLPVNRLKGLK